LCHEEGCETNYMKNPCARHVRGLCCPGHGHTLSPATCWYPYSLLALSAPLSIVSLHCLAPLSPLSHPCHCYLPLSLPPLSLSIPVGGDMAVSTCSTLWVNAHSGGGQVLGHCHFCCLLPTLSLTTHPPCKLGLVAVVVSGLWQWCGVVLSLVPFHLWSTPWAVACEAGGSWLVILVSRHYPMPL